LAEQRLQSHPSVERATLRADEQILWYYHGGFPIPSWNCWAMRLAVVLCYRISVFHNQSMEYIPTESQYRSRFKTTLEVLSSPETTENGEEIVMEKASVTAEKRAKTSINLKQRVSLSRVTVVS
jgi:hypothetical protein